MRQTVQKTMAELHMIEAGERLLVGVSGGADSVCLLVLLKELESTLGFSLEAVHVEHGIRGEESRQDERFVVALCQQYDVPLTCVRVDVPAYVEKTGMSVEEAARVLRYEAFSNIAREKNAKVALAHHMEDNAETILFQMLRGSSLAGLCGMQTIRQDEDGVVYIRPLLCIHRKDIEDFLKEKGQGYCTDSTNKELEYSRNYLRNVVLPQLNKINTQAVAHLNGTAERLGDIWDYMEMETEKAWQNVAHVQAQEVMLDVKTLQELHVAIQKEVVLRAIAAVSGSRKDIAAVHVADVLALCEKQSGREIQLPYQVVAQRDFDEIHISILEDVSVSNEKLRTFVVVPEEDLTTAFATGEALEIPLSDEGGVLRMKVFSYDGKSAEIPKKPYTKWFDYDKIKQGFCIRRRQSGDYFIVDALGHHKKLKSYFVDEKISKTKREQMWLLAQESTVLWLIGGRISEHVKVTDATDTVIEIEYQGGN